MDTEEEEELEEMRKGFQGMKFNIIFTDPKRRVGGEEWEEDEEWIDEDEFDEEDEDEDIDEEDEEDMVSLGDNVKMSKKEYELHKKKKASYSIKI